MNRTHFLTAAATLLLASTALHAQMPVDNDTWKARCGAVASMANLDHLSPQVVALTKGVDGPKFTTFAFDRQAAGQHNVACTLFYLGAIANAAKADASEAKDAATMAALEIKAIHNQEPSWSESMVRVKVKAKEITRPALSLADEQAVMAAATTIPFTSASIKPVSMQQNQRPALTR
jgi:hypothetical protein